MKTALILIATNNHDIIVNKKGGSLLFLQNLSTNWGVSLHLHQY